MVDADGPVSVSAVALFRYRVTWRDGMSLVVRGVSSDDAVGLAALVRYHDGVGNPKKSRVLRVEVVGFEGSGLVSTCTTVPHHDEVRRDPSWSEVFCESCYGCYCLATDSRLCGCVGGSPACGVARPLLGCSLDQFGVDRSRAMVGILDFKGKNGIPRWTRFKSGVNCLDVESYSRGVRVYEPKRGAL